MAPRGFDRYMVSVGAGRHPKFARLTDSERCAHFLGVLAIAAMSPVRGRLLVGKLPAEAIDIAQAAGVSRGVAASAIRKLELVGILEHDEEHGCLRVHDWDDINPSPGAQRTRRWRDNSVTPTRHTNVTATVTETSPEVEVEVEVEAETSSQQVARKRARQPVDQTRLPDGFPVELAEVHAQSLLLLHAAWELRGGVEPMERGVGLAMMRSPRADHLTVARKLQHWLTAGAGQRAQCKDIAARFGDWVQDEGAALRVVGGGSQRSAVLEHADRWKRYYQQEGEGA